jgi:hypothetical protein
MGGYFIANPDYWSRDAFMFRDLEKEIEESSEEADLNTKTDEAKARSRQLASRLEAEKDTIIQKKLVLFPSFNFCYSQIS